MTIIPIPTDSKPCIQLRNGCWYAAYRMDGKAKLHTLRTDDFSEALPLRDAFYAKLLKQGAIRRKKKTPTEKVAENPDRYIHQRDPFVVTILGTVIGTAATLEEAEKLRDDYLARL